MNAIKNSIIQFDLPAHLACPKPTEERGLRRDEVRLLVTSGAGLIAHTLFNKLGDYLQPGDVLVVNSSATLPSALPIALPNGRKGVAHLSNKLNTHEWLIEIREITGSKTIRWKEGEQGVRFDLPEEASLTLKKRYYHDHQLLDLWIADLNIHQQPEAYLVAHANPINYDKLDEHYPLAYYQTFFSFQPGSAEMPSAGRGFTRELVEKLLTKGVVLAPVLLHTGVSSLEEHETPYPEYVEISPVSAAIVNTAKSQGKRIIAVGTTAIRAIESAVHTAGRVTPYQGHTNLYIEESYAMKMTDGLLTGFHEPRASHLHMLQSLAGFEHLGRAYQAAIQADYYWHQFGDLHLILP